MEHEDLMSITEAALLYGRSRMSFVWLVSTGRIPHVLIGKRKFVARADVEALAINSAAKEHKNSYIEPVQRRA